MDEGGSRLQLLLAELRRRKVFRVAIVYAAVAFIIWQVAEIAVPGLNLPSWVLTLVILLTALGFPVAVGLAWAFDITPAGVKRAESETATAERRAAPTMEGAAERKSIVVLPFDNMSPDPTDAYLSDGLTEEIITGLSCCRPLRVISRNSARVLKGTDKDTRTIARELDVQYVLEGSVRKAGNDLRVTAQLIDGRTDEHLWSERYSGTLDDVFDMQERLSCSIVDALMLELSPEEERRLTERPIDNVQAYECYLRARQETWQWTKDALDRARQHLQNALDIIGENALLLAGMGYVSARAVELDPFAPLVNVWLGVAYFYANRYDDSIDQHKRVLELDPSNVWGHTYLAHNYVMKGMNAAAVAHADTVQAISRTTGNPGLVAFVGGDYAWAGERDEAERILEEVLDLHAQGTVGAMAVALIYAGLGETDSTFVWLRRGVQERGGTVVWLKAYGRTHLRDLRPDPRYDELLRLVGFED